MEPTIGRIVLYTFGSAMDVVGRLSRTIPAIVVAVHSPTKINLRAFSDSPDIPVWVRDVEQEDINQLDDPKKGTWTWPVRA